MTFVRTARTSSSAHADFHQTINGLHTDKEDEATLLKSADSAKEMFKNAFEVQTIENGYNSGRTYYLKAPSEQVGESICGELTRNAKRAKDAADASTRFQKAQNAVLAFYDSTPFQMFVATLILAVMSPLSMQAVKNVI